MRNSEQDQMVFQPTTPRSFASAMSTNASTPSIPFQHASFMTPPASPPSGRTDITFPSTPHKSVTSSTVVNKVVADLKRTIMEELTGAWFEHAEFHTLLGVKADEYDRDLHDKAQNWLGSYDGYRDGRWVAIAAVSSTSAEDQLYEPTIQVLNDIIEGLGHAQCDSTEAGTRAKKRVVRDTSKDRMVHKVTNSDFYGDGEAGYIKTAPDLSVLTVGPAAAKEETFLGRTAYSQVGTPIEMKKGVQFTEKEKAQVAVYAREVFVQQANRSFVYVPLMTQKTLRPIRFDRSGVHYSPPFNFHRQPLLFIKLVSLFTSLDESLMGYDTSIYWKDNKRLMKMVDAQVRDDACGANQRWYGPAATLEFEILDADSGLATLDPKPMFHRYTIRSRGTVCWRVRNPLTEEEFLVKKYWAAMQRASEAEYLKDATDIKGLGQLYAYSEPTRSTFDDRLVGDEERAALAALDILDRVAISLVLHMYGPSLNKAMTALVLLRAIRDIVHGHRDLLLMKKILHRDISGNNLLLSSISEHGEGALIDLDMAKRIVDLLLSAKTSGDGTRAFQSIRVLCHPNVGYHDHLDDLESMLYVLIWVLCGHDSQGRQLVQLPQRLNEMMNPFTSPFALGDVKRALISIPYGQLITRFTDSATQEILLGLTTMLYDDVFSKRLRMVDLTVFQMEQGKVPRTKLLHEFDPAVVNKDYDAFLEPLEAAIRELEELECRRPSASVEVALPPDPAPPTQSALLPTTSSPKRRRGPSDGSRKRPKIDEASSRVSSRLSHDSANETIADAESEDGC
ncbi:unnamed protein product [Mycena citricolor]|uniref:Protein kinase domain-containing protein n=1 Tax=Mycena citricolor TaxID=2018698 RepID=A0AAD2GUZ2_9AGAR|nr:unnamed protein product [Mycena citricolor]